MKQIFVNDIFEQGDATCGLAVIPRTVEQGLRMIYAPDKLKQIFKEAEKLQNGIYYFTTFCQFVVYVQIKFTPQFDGLLNFIDCHNNSDIALDEFSEYMKAEWSEESRRKFMLCFQEIESNPPQELAELVVKDPLTSPSSYF